MDTAHGRHQCIVLSLPSFRNSVVLCSVRVYCFVCTGISRRALVPMAQTSTLWPISEVPAGLVSHRLYSLATISSRLRVDIYSNQFFFRVYTSRGNNICTTPQMVVSVGKSTPSSTVRHCGHRLTSPRSAQCNAHCTQQILQKL